MECWRKRRRSEIPLPNLSAIKLDEHAVRRDDSTLLPVLSPDVAGPVDPRSRGGTRFVDEI